MIIATRWWGGSLGCSDQRWSNVGGMWPANREPPGRVPVKFTRGLPMGVAVGLAGNQAVVGVWGVGWGFRAQWKLSPNGSCHLEAVTRKLTVSELWFLWNSL